MAWHGTAKMGRKMRESVDAENSGKVEASFETHKVIRVSKDNALVVTLVLSGLLVPRALGIDRRSGIHLRVDTGIFSRLNRPLGKTEMNHPSATDV